MRDRPVRVLGRVARPDGTIREVIVEAPDHGTAKIAVKADVGPEERLLAIRLLEDDD